MPDISQNIFVKMAHMFNQKDRHPQLSAYFSFKNCTPELLEKVCLDFYQTHKARIKAANKDPFSSISRVGATDAEITSDPHTAVRLFQQIIYDYCDCAPPEYNQLNSEIEKQLLNSQNKLNSATTNSAGISSASNQREFLTAIQHSSLTAFIEKNLLSVCQAISLNASNQTINFLHLAVKYLSPQKLEAFIKQLDNTKLLEAVNKPNNHDETLLHAAAKNPNAAIFIQLIDKVFNSSKALNSDAIFSTKNANGENVLHLIHTPRGRDFTQHDMRKLVQVIPKVSFGAALIEQNTNGDTPLHIATKHWVDSHSLELFINNVSDKDFLEAFVKRNQQKRTPLHLLAERNNSGDVQPLLKALIDRVLKMPAQEFQQGFKHLIKNLPKFKFENHEVTHNLYKKALQQFANKATSEQLCGIFT